MQPMFLIVTTGCDNNVPSYRYAQSEEEARLRMRERADDIVSALAKDPLRKVYIERPKDGGDGIKVVVQEVGSLWNGLLRPHTVIRMFAVHHVQVDDPSTDDADVLDDLFAEKPCLKNTSPQ